MTLEQGKPLAESRMEAAAGADVIDWFAEEGRRAYGRIVPARATNVSQLVVKEPVGPVAAFSPWNFPINQAVRKISAALAAGCSIIIKGPEDTPASCAALAAAFADAGTAARRAQPGVRRSDGDQRLPHPASGDQENLLHGVDRCRQTACVARWSPHETGDDGAWRPRAGNRVRRRRCRSRRQGSGRVEISQRGPGLRRPDPVHCARERLSQISSMASSRPRSRSRSAMDSPKA